MTRFEEQKVYIYTFKSPYRLQSLQQKSLDGHSCCAASIREQLQWIVPFGQNGEEPKFHCPIFQSLLHKFQQLVCPTQESSTSGLRIRPLNLSTRFDYFSDDDDADVDVKWERCRTVASTQTSMTSLQLLRSLRGIRMTLRSFRFNLALNLTHRASFLSMWWIFVEIVNCGNKCVFWFLWIAASVLLIPSSSKVSFSCSFDKISGGLFLF